VDDRHALSFAGSCIWQLVGGVCLDGDRALDPAALCASDHQRRSAVLQKQREHESILVRAILVLHVLNSQFKTNASLEKVKKKTWASFPTKMYLNSASYPYFLSYTPGSSSMVLRHVLHPSSISPPCIYDLGIVVLMLTTLIYNRVDLSTC